MATKIDLLIQGGTLLAKDIRQTKEADPYKIMDKIFNYDSWRFQIVGYLRSKKELLAEQTALGLDTLTIDPVNWAYSFLDKKTKATAVRLYIENIGKWNELLEKLRPKMKEEKVKIFISDAFGIYRNENNKKITCRITRKRLDLLYLILRKRSTELEFIELYKHGAPDINKAIKGINKRLKQKLGLTDNLIVRKETDGYRFNDEYIVVG